jgi:glutaredoxin
MKFEIWTRRTPRCSYCEAAKLTFKHFDLPYEETVVTADENEQLPDGVNRASRDDLLAKNMCAKTFPQIWMHDEAGNQKYIGGYDDLRKWMSENNIPNPKK